MTSDNDSFFVDANVLVYAALKDDPRNKAAKAVLKDSSRGTLHISPQILTEFYSTITSRFFQLPNHSHAVLRSFLLAFSIAASARRKSYLPSSGSIHAHARAVSTVFRWTWLASMGKILCI